MARKKPLSIPLFEILAQGLARPEMINLQALIEEVGLPRILEAIGLATVIQEIGSPKFMEIIGLNSLMDHLGPEERSFVQQRIQQSRERRRRAVAGAARRVRTSS